MTTPIIPPNGAADKLRPALSVSFIAPATGAVCACCGAPVTNPYTTPPLCEIHLDLVILLSHMQQHDIPINLANIQDQLDRAIAQGGQWTLTKADLPRLLNDLLAGGPDCPDWRLP